MSSDFIPITSHAFPEASFCTPVDSAILIFCLQKKVSKISSFNLLKFLHPIKIWFSFSIIFTI